MASLIQPRTRRLSHDEALALWKEYRETGDRSIRDRLVLTLAPMVKYIVYKKFKEIPATCDIEDFVSCGLEAVIGLIERYDPERGATIEQFAWTRIHGAVLDELRHRDWRPRSLRRWERDMARATREFNGVHGRAPGQQELADAMGVALADLEQRQREIVASDVTSLNQLIAGDDGVTVERIDTIASTDDDVDPEHHAALTQVKERFRGAFATLPSREREIAVLLYVKNLTLREVAEILGVSESRVCQIHGQLKRNLRTALADDEQLFRAVA